MDTFECKISDLDKTNKLSTKPIKTSAEKNSTEILSDLGKNSTNLDKNLNSTVGNLQFLKVICIILLIYIIIHSPIFINIILNTFEFLGNDGQLNIFGNLLLFSILFITYFLTVYTVH